MKDWNESRNIELKLVSLTELTEARYLIIDLEMREIAIFLS